MVDWLLWLGPVTGAVPVVGLAGGCALAKSLPHSDEQGDPML